MIELPVDFLHKPPKGYSYECRLHKRNYLSIWCVNHTEFVYNDGSTTKTIWGFYNTKQRTYYAPINSTKCGNQVDINSTTPYTAMQILKPLAPTVLNFL